MSPEKKKIKNKYHRKTFIRSAQNLKLNNQVNKNSYDANNCTTALLQVEPVQL